MRDVERIWGAWKSGVYVGDTRPSTRLTVEKGWSLQVADQVGTWTRGPARWFQRADTSKQIETEVPNLVSVNITRSVDSDVGSCDLVIQNTVTPLYGQPETPAGQFGDIGHFTWDHGTGQEAKARWGHVSNPWSEVLVPNALLRTYVGFGGTDLPVDQAVAAGFLVLYGVWLVDEVTIQTDGTLSLRCRDIGKLLVDQQLFPPMMPTNLYPLDYHRWVITGTKLPGEPAPPGDYCYAGYYWNSSTDEYYGEWITRATGHPGTDAFDNSTETGVPDVPGAYAHQRTYWLSEPKDDPNDTVWIEFNVNGGEAGIINQIYYHAWKGAIEGHGVHRIMVSVWENGAWVSPETDQGGITPQSIPYVCTFVPGTEIAPAVASNLYNLPRDYRATLIRLTVTSLIWADDFPYGFGDPDPHNGYRAGARKIMACFSAKNGDIRIPPLTYACAAIPVNEQNRIGYWQIKANGQLFAFGDARVQPVTSPSSAPASTVVGMCVHPDGNGYWYTDMCGRVVSAGSAPWQGDLYGNDLTNVVDIAPSPNGYGYWLLRNDGTVNSYGTTAYYGDSVHSATLPDGSPAIAKSIESHPTIQGYWVLWSDGYITAHNLPHYGNADDRTGFALGEWNTAIRRTPTGSGYLVTSSLGRVQAKGDAKHKGNAGLSGYDAKRWYQGVCWDILTTSEKGDKGYAIQSADGKLWICGDFHSFGSIGSGHVDQRFDGNYKDYSDIVKELCLWAGFYLYRDPQPTDKFPDVYGNIETTGAYAEHPLPKEMFDKRPIIEAIKALREIVGYLVFIDPEGGVRWESPNIWSLGNFLSNVSGDQRAPFPYMPEIDETVQLIGHAVTRSASEARSRLIIATQDPYPVTPGKDPPKGVVTTEIIPKTAPDLKGLVVPAMWTNGKFLLPEEQQVMADLIDMRMWFSRRTASVSCVANPLIDINDQVRVIERQTGDVFIHYIRGVSFHHDLNSGDFKMDLTTHWLGGSLWGKDTLFYTGAMRPQGDGYWTATMGGSKNGSDTRAGIYGYGNAQVYDSHEADSHLEPIMAMRSTPSGDGYYTMDESGKVLSYGDAVNQGSVHRGMATPDHNRRCGDASDLALTPSGIGYWIVQKDGTVTAFGDAVHMGNATPAGNLPDGAEIFAIGIESHPNTMGYWILMTDGSVEAHGLPDHGRASIDPDTKTGHATSLRRTASGNGYLICLGGGPVFAKGDASLQSLNTGYVVQDIGAWYEGLFWDILVAPDDTYGLVRSNGEIVPYQFDLYPAGDVRPRQAYWAVVAPEDARTLGDPNAAFPVSPEIMSFLAGTASPSANNAVVNNFGAPSTDAIVGSEQ